MNCVIVDVLLPSCTVVIIAPIAVYVSSQDVILALPLLLLERAGGCLQDTEYLFFLGGGGNDRKIVDVEF